MRNIYDVVIVGSGLGGLVCGALLAKEGKKVVVLEQHDRIGGNLQVFKRKGCSFSAGMHYSGSLDKGQVLYKVFKYFGVYEELKTKKLDVDCFEKIIIGDKEYSYAMGVENFEQSLLKYFPEEKLAIRKYIEKLQQIWDQTDMLNLRDINFSEMMNFQRYEENAFEYINSITLNDELRAVLAGTNGLYAGIKEKTPLYVHANINMSFINSAWRIADSGENMAALLKNVIEENGGGVFVNKDVKKFNFTKGLITSVQVNRDEVFEGEHFISNVHPNETFRLIEPGKLRKVYVNRITELPNSVATFALFIVLKKKGVKHINSNIYFSKTTDVWDSHKYTIEEWPKGYMMYTSEDSQNEGYAESMVVLSMMNFEELQEWEATYVNKRGDNYKAFKEAKTNALLALVYEKFPSLEGQIELVESASPLTFRDYTRSEKGAMYGIVKDNKNPVRTMLSPKTKVPNLLFTGQNIGLHGMIGVVMTAFQTCSGLMDVNKVIREIRSVN